MRVFAVLFALCGLLPVATVRAADDCETVNGARSLGQVADEVRGAGYSGPWDRASVLEAYGRASGGPVTCGPPAMAVVFVGGYGTDLDGASAQFADVRDAIAERSPSTLIVQFSYTGTSFDGCTAAPSWYSTIDTAQAIETSTRVLRETLARLHEACNVDHIAIVGHSLGGLIAFRALDEGSGVSDLITVDAPMGGVPRRLVQTCVDIGFCADGAVANDLAQLYGTPGLEAANAAHASQLTAAGVRVSAWGNDSDCFYAVVLCAPIAQALLGPIDARATQWLGMPGAVHRGFPITRSLASIAASHTAVLTRSAGELAAALME